VRYPAGTVGPNGTTVRILPYPGDAHGDAGDEPTLLWPIRGEEGTVVLVGRLRRRMRLRALRNAVPCVLMLCAAVVLALLALGAPAGRSAAPAAAVVPRPAPPPVVVTAPPAAVIEAPSPPIAGPDLEVRPPRRPARAAGGAISPTPRPVPAVQAVSFEPVEEPGF
jgi:hypothetical protein